MERRTGNQTGRRTRGKTGERGMRGTLTARPCILTLKLGTSKQGEPNKTANIQIIKILKPQYTSPRTRNTSTRRTPAAPNSSTNQTWTQNNRATTSSTFRTSNWRKRASLTTVNIQSTVTKWHSTLLLGSIIPTSANNPMSILISL